MCTDCTVTRMSSDRVAMRPIVNRMTDRRLWIHYLPLRSVKRKKFAFHVVVTITRTGPFTQIFLPGDKTVVRAISLSLWLRIITLFVPNSHATGIWTLAPGFPVTPVTIFWKKIMKSLWIKEDYRPVALSQLSLSRLGLDTEIWNEKYAQYFQIKVKISF